MAEYAVLREEAGPGYSLPEAHFPDAELRGKWVLNGQPALVDSTSPRKERWPRRVRWNGWNWRATATAGPRLLLKQLRDPEPMRVIWDNAPAHRCGNICGRGLDLRLVNLPGYSPDFNSDEAVWGWAREEATGRLGSRAAVRKGSATSWPGWPAGERGEAPLPDGTAVTGRSTAAGDSSPQANAHPTLALV